jgi:hypothetical protein
MFLNQLYVSCGRPGRPIISKIVALMALSLPHMHPICEALIYLFESTVHLKFSF